MQQSSSSAAANFANFSEGELTTLLQVMCNSLLVRRHEDLFRWLHGEIQGFIPHDILIAAWGDFNLGLVHLDVMSYLPGMRTKEVNQKDLLPLLLNLFGDWAESKRTPFVVVLEGEHRALRVGSQDTPLNKAISSMNTALVQGIKDERGRHDCLYVAMSTRRSCDPRAREAMQLLLPYIDAALRQVAHLPVQYPDLPDVRSDVEVLERSAGSKVQADEAGEALSEREQQIMRWVSQGKTNPEIGSILDISYFTVKNHLQRIYRKLDVFNRAQAVSKFNAMTRSGDRKAKAS